MSLSKKKKFSNYRKTKFMKSNLLKRKTNKRKFNKKKKSKLFGGYGKKSTNVYPDLFEEVLRVVERFIPPSTTKPGRPVPENEPPESNPLVEIKTSSRTNANPTYEQGSSNNYRYNTFLSSDDEATEPYYAEIPDISAYKTSTENPYGQRKAFSGNPPANAATKKKNKTKHVKHNDQIVNSPNNV